MTDSPDFFDQIRLSSSIHPPILLRRNPHLLLEKPAEMLRILKPRLVEQRSLPQPNSGNNEPFAGFNEWKSRGRRQSAFDREPVLAAVLIGWGLGDWPQPTNRAIMALRLKSIFFMFVKTERWLCRQHPCLPKKSTSFWSTFSPCELVAGAHVPDMLVIKSISTSSTEG